jgi:hypothetical protein
MSRTSSSSPHRTLPFHRSRFGRARQLGQADAELFDHGGLGGAYGAVVDRAAQVGQHPVLGVPGGPVVAVGVPHGSASDVRVPRAARRRGAERGCPGGVQGGEAATETDRRAGGGPPLPDPVDHQPTPLVTVHHRDADRAGLGQPAQPGRLGLDRAGLLPHLHHDHPPAVEGDFGERAGQRAHLGDRAPGETRGRFTRPLGRHPVPRCAAGRGVSAQRSRAPARITVSSGTTAPRSSSVSTRGSTPERVGGRSAHDNALSSESGSEGRRPVACDAGEMFQRCIDMWVKRFVAWAII